MPPALDLLGGTAPGAALAVNTGLIVAAMTAYLWGLVVALIIAVMVSW